MPLIRWERSLERAAMQARFAESESAQLPALRRQKVLPREPGMEAKPGCQKEAYPDLVEESLA